MTSPFEEYFGVRRPVRADGSVHVPRLPDTDDAPPRPTGLVYEVYFDSGRSPNRWRFVEVLRATSPSLAYRLARDRNPAHRGQAMRVEGPGGSLEGDGR